MLRVSALFFAAAAVLSSAAAHASIGLNTTRVIIDEGRREASFGVRNRGSAVLVQSWLTGPNGEDVDNFTLTPQLVRVRAGGEQLVRVLYSGLGAPADRETMLWLNVQEIPQRDAEGGNMDVAVLQRIKVFYRPPGLKGSAQAAAENLGWSVAGSQLAVHNPGAFHITLVNASLSSAPASPVFDAAVVPPGETLRFSLRHTLSGKSGKAALEYRVVNDFGGQDAYRVMLEGERPAKPTPVSK